MLYTNTNNFSVNSLLPLAGFITATVIVVSRCFSINPDNVATPIAASLGDITSLILLSWVASILYDANGKKHHNIIFEYLKCRFLKIKLT
jgi:acetylglutamate kinase